MSAMPVCVPGSQYSLWKSNKILFLSFGQGVYIFKENPISVKDAIGTVYCPSCKYCFNSEKCDNLDDYIRNPRPIFSCGKCGAWLFPHKVPFMLQEHIEATKTTKTRFFLVRKKLFCYPTDNCSLLSCFKQSNTERKNRVSTAKYKELLEMCIVQYAEMKMSLHFWIIRNF